MQHIKQILIVLCLSAFVAACGGGGGGGGGGDPAPSSGQSGGGSASPGTTTPPPTTGNGGTTPPPPSEPNQADPGQNSFTIRLSWAPPSTREDGSALSMSELSGYEIYYYRDGTDASQGQVKQVAGGATNSTDITLASTGTYYFAIAAKDQNGLISNLSNYVSATFD